MKIIGITFSFLLSIGIYHQSREYNIDNQSVKTILTSNINSLITAVKNFKTEKSKPNFKTMRSAFFVLSWSYFPLDLIEEQRSVNDMKFKVLDSSECYESYGSLQMIEHELLQKEPNEEKIQLALAALEGFIRQLEDKISQHEWSIPEVLAALMIQQQDIYASLLTASYHLDTEEVINDYDKILNQHLILLKHLNEAKHYSKYYKRLSNYFRRKTFNDISYIDCYERNILPLHQKFLKELQKNYPAYQINMSTIRTTLDEKGLFNKDWISPTHFHGKDFDLGNEKRIQLGKLLFYDPILSINNKRTCASCHQPQKAFTDGRTTSIALDYPDRLKTNSPTLINSIYNIEYGHDRSKKTLQEQIDFVIHSNQEFGSTYKEIISKLNASKAYRQYFKLAFPKRNKIDSTQISKAITSYVATLNSFESDFDHLMQGNKQVKDSEKVLKGFDLFMGKAQCGICHQPPLFSGLNTVAGSQQYYICKEDVKTKVPTLRNIDYTIPYMYDGRISSKKALFDYLFKQHVWYEDNYEDKLNADEKELLITFFESLNDTTALQFSATVQLPNVEDTSKNIDRRPGGLY